MRPDEQRFDLPSTLSRFPVVAVVRVSEVQRLPMPMLTPVATSHVVVSVKGAAEGESLRWSSLGDFWFPQRGSEALCAFQESEGDPRLVVRAWSGAAALAQGALPEDLAAWVRAQAAPMSCAQCDVPVPVRNRSALARDVMEGLLFCPRHVPALRAHVAEVVQGTVDREGASPPPTAPGTRYAVDLGLARRGVFASPDAPCVWWEVDGEGKRVAAALLPMPTFTDDAGRPRKRARKCPGCGEEYGSVRPLGICPSCGRKHLADLVDLLD